MIEATYGFEANSKSFYDQIRKIMCREEGFNNNNNNLPIK